MNEACCTRPPIASDYEPIGKHEELDNGMKTYIVGPSSATRGIILAYDALGYSQPLLMGADLLAASVNALVFSPDFFRGEVVPPTVFGLSPEERGQFFGKWMSGPGDMGKGISNAFTVLSELKTKYPQITSWALHGYCWGGKLAAIISSKGTEFKVSGASHPGRIDPEEARNMKVPHISLLSGEDGSDEEAADYAKALKESGQDVVYDRFQDQVHGWMAARADLKDEKVKAEYERGYKMVSDFFNKHL